MQLHKQMTVSHRLSPLSLTHSLPLSYARMHAYTQAHNLPLSSPSLPTSLHYRTTVYKFNLLQNLQIWWSSKAKYDSKGRLSYSGTSSPSTCDQVAADWLTYTSMWQSARQKDVFPQSSITINLFNYTMTTDSSVWVYQGVRELPSRHSSNVVSTRPWPNSHLEAGEQ